MNRVRDFLARYGRITLRVVLYTVNIVHPLVHGTVFDRGIIDACLEPLDFYMMQVDAWLASFAVR